MRAGARRRAHRADARHAVGKQRAPVQRLLAAHRPAVNQRQPRDAERLAQQTLLRVHVVPVREQRIAAETERLGQVARRGRQPVAQLVGDDDEVALGIEDAIARDQPLDVGVMRPVRGGIEDDVRLVGRQPAIGLVGEACAGQRQPALQRQRADLESLIVRCGHRTCPPECASPRRLNVSPPHPASHRKQARSRPPFCPGRCSASPGVQPYHAEMPMHLALE